MAGRVLIRSAEIVGIVPKAEAPTLKTVAWEIELQVIDNDLWLEKVAGGFFLKMDDGDDLGGGDDGGGSAAGGGGYISGPRAPGLTNPGDCKADIATGAGLGAALGASIGALAGPAGAIVGTGIGILAGGALAASNSASCQPKKGN